MPESRPEVLEFLLSRRSRPAKTLAPPAPGRDVVLRLLTAAVRVPDHGKLEPWRFVVLEGPALARVARAIRARGAATGEDPEKVANGFETAPMVIALVSRPQPSDKVPAVEQLLSAGAVGISLVNAALAAGWGAQWLTGWPAYDRGFVERELGLGPAEAVVGFVHVGTERVAPPDRPRPDVERLVEWPDR